MSFAHLCLALLADIVVLGCTIGLVIPMRDHCFDQIGKPLCNREVLAACLPFCSSRSRVATQALQLVLEAALLHWIGSDMA